MNKRLTGVALAFFLAIPLIAQQPNTDDPNSVPSQCVAGVDYELSLAALQGSDDTEPAMKQADECVRRYPALADAWIRRGHLHVNRNEYDAALADFTKAIELDPKNADTYNSRAWVYGAKDNFASAYADYDKALALDANSIDAYIGRGDLHRMKSEEAQARAEYNKAIEVADTGNGLYFVGGAYLGRGLLEMSRMNWAAAEKDLTLAIKETFGSAEQAYSARALVYEFIGKEKEAMADYDTLLRIRSRNTEALERRGSLLLKQGQKEKATADFKALIALDPKNAKAIEALSTLDPKSAKDFIKVARAKAGEQKWSEAIALYDKAIAAEPSNADAYLGRAGSYANSGNTDRALADYDKGLALNPNDLGGYNGRGSIYRDKGDIAKATADYDRVIANAKSDNDVMDLVIALQNRGEVRAKQNQNDAARADYDKAIEVAAKEGITNYILTPDSYLGRAKLSIAAGNKDAARADLKKALELNPKHEAVKAALLEIDPPQPTTAEDFLKVALAAGQKNDAKGAIDALKRCIELDPKSMQCHGFLARAHVATGDLAAATEDMTHVIELNPKDPTGYAGRGVTYAMQGKRDEAIRDFRRALDIKPDFEEAKQALKQLGVE